MFLGLAIENKCFKRTWYQIPQSMRQGIYHFQSRYDNDLPIFTAIDENDLEALDILIRFDQRYLARRTDRILRNITAYIYSVRVWWLLEAFVTPAMFYHRSIGNHTALDNILLRNCSADVVDSIYKFICLRGGSWFRCLSPHTLMRLLYWDINTKVVWDRLSDREKETYVSMYEYHQRIRVFTPMSVRCTLTSLLASINYDPHIVHLIRRSAQWSSILEQHLSFVGNDDHDIFDLVLSQRNMALLMDVLQHWNNLQCTEVVKFVKDCASHNWIQGALAVCQYFPTLEDRMYLFNESVHSRTMFHTLTLELSFPNDTLSSYFRDYAHETLWLQYSRCIGTILHLLAKIRYRHVILLEQIYKHVFGSFSFRMSLRSFDGRGRLPLDYVYRNECYITAEWRRALSFLHPFLNNCELRKYAPTVRSFYKHLDVLPASSSHIRTRTLLTYVGGGVTQFLGHNIR